MIHPPVSNKNPVSFMKNLVHYSNAGLCVNESDGRRSREPFHSIESAHEFMLVLENVIVDAQGELQTMLDDANSASDDRRDGSVASGAVQNLSARNPHAQEPAHFERSGADSIIAGARVVLVPR